MKKIILIILICTVSYPISSQCSTENTDDTLFGNVSAQTGQSFTTTCNGILNTIGIIAFNNTINTTVTIRSGEGYGGSVLGTLTNQITSAASNFTDYSVFDFSSLNITLIAGQSYTFDISASVVIAYDNQNDPDYTNGQRYESEIPQVGTDLLFTVDLNAIPCTDPDIPTVTYTPSLICEGSDATLSISGNLNDATQWHIYTGSCGGTELGTTASNTFLVTPAAPSTTYFVRGEGGLCVIPSSCGTVTVNTTPLDNASFNYSASDYCIDTSDPTPTITGLSGGNFSATPAGLSISSTTGVIDLSASTPATYTVTYTTTGTCPNSETTSITVNTLDNATFTYSAADYCIDASDPTPTITGLSGGNFSAIPAGLSVSSTTGVIDLSASTPATYTVTYTTAGTCPSSETATITVTALDDATFTYSAADYCIDASNPTPTITGLSGGIFSVTPAGLSIASTTGVIDLSTSTPATYTVTYTTTGACPNSETTTVTINALDDATFTYSATDYCIDAIDPTPTITGLSGGNFSATPAGLSIAATTGVIDLSGSTPATYTVTYATIGTCSNSETATITVNELDDATFTYSTTDYCIDDIDPSPTVTGLSGGSFSVTPAGLSISNTTGTIDLSTSTPATYTITYTTIGTCPNSETTTITINTLDDAAFTYSASDYCVGTSDPTPTITGLSGGSFSAIPSGLSISASTGVIDLSTSTPGTYSVTYTTTGTCPTSETVTITVNPLDDATFTYSTSDYCIDTSDPTPTITGLSGGVFSAIPSGLSISSSTGIIDLSASTPATYTVIYTTTGVCPTGETATITINPLGDPSFNYSASDYCINDIDPSPTVAGQASGTFSATPTGLSISNSTGTIDLSNSIPGTYTVMHTTDICPNSSFVTVNINETDASVDDSANPTFTSNTAGASYQWVNCNTDTPIPGETNQSFTATQNGSYAVDVTLNGCIQRSACFNVGTLSIDDVDFTNLIRVYPIPTKDKLNISIVIPTITVYNIIGKIVFKAQNTNSINISELNPGVYFMNLETEKGSAIKRIIKE